MEIRLHCFTVKVVSASVKAIAGSMRVVSASHASDARRALPRLSLAVRVLALLITALNCGVMSLVMVIEKSDFVLDSMLVSDVNPTWCLLRRCNLESALFVAHKERWEAFIFRQIGLLARLLTSIAPKLEALSHVFRSKGDGVTC